jgi:HAD superfamily hydrolase (TIGR01484 family)
MLKTAAKPIALIATDLDGTLLTSAGELASQSAIELKQAVSRGLSVVVATTRNPYFAVPICRSLGSTAPLIASNGAQVWGSPDGPVWAYHAIPRQAARAIAQFADMNDWALAITIDQKTYYRQRPGQALGPLTANTSVVAANVDAVTGAPLRILVWGEEAIHAI